MRRKIIVTLCFFSLLIGLALYLRNHVTLAQLAEHEMYLRSAIDKSPVLSFLGGLALYSLVSLVPGTSGKSIVCGYLFGFWQSLAMVLIGLANAAMVSFWMSRYVVRDWVEHKFSGLLGGMNRMIERDGSFYLLTLRMAHVPYTLINYCSGASRIASWSFLWTTVVGLLPGTVLFVYLGSQLPTLHEIALHGASSLLNPGIAVGLVGMAFLPVVVRFLVRKIRAYKHKGVYHLSNIQNTTQEKLK